MVGFYKPGRGSMLLHYTFFTGSALVLTGLTGYFAVKTLGRLVPDSISEPVCGYATSAKETVCGFASSALSTVGIGMKPPAVQEQKK